MNTQIYRHYVPCGSQCQHITGLPYLFYLLKTWQIGIKGRIYYYIFDHCGCIHYILKGFILNCELTADKHQEQLHEGRLFVHKL